MQCSVKTKEGAAFIFNCWWEALGSETKKITPTFPVILAIPAKSGIALQTRSELGKTEERKKIFTTWLGYSKSAKT